MKIYVITKGEYSDYHICAVVKDYDKAQILQKKFSGNFGIAEIEEFDTEVYNDVCADKDLYIIRFDKNGNVKNVYIEDDWDYFDPEDNPVNIYSNDNSVVVYVLAFNEESAIKIAAEKRAIELVKRGYV